MADVRAFRDLFEGRAYLRFGPVSALMLLHWAGAPWNDKVENCHLSALQAEALMRPERETIVHGGSGVGKSVLGGSEATLEAMTPLAKCFVIGGIYEHVEKEFEYLQRGMRTLFRGHQSALTRMVCSNKGGHQDYDCQTLWGARARGLSTDSRDGASVLGNEASKIILAEGSQIKASILGRRIWRALDRFRMHSRTKAARYAGFLRIFTTPNEYMGVSAAEFQRVRKAGKGDITVMNAGKVPWSQSVWIREAASSENPTYDTEAMEAARLRAEQTGEWAAYEEQYLGKMTYTSGRIFTEYDPLRDAVERPPVSELYMMRFAVGIDEGAHSAAVLVGMDMRRRLWLLGEVYDIKVRTEVFCASIQSMITRILAPVYGTDDWGVLSSRIDDFFVDPAAHVKLDIAYALEIHGLTPAHRGEGKFELHETVSQMRAMFASRRLHVCKDLDDFNDQAERYIWKIQRVSQTSGIATKEPLKVDDHVIDAARYAIIPLSQEEPLQEPPEPVTFAEAYARQQSKKIQDDLREGLNPLGGTYSGLKEMWS